MENNQPQNNGNTKRKVLIGLSTLVIGTLAFFGINHHLKKNKKNETSDNKSDTPDTEDPVQNSNHTQPGPGLPANRAAGDTFPLHLGSRGDKVRILQQQLMAKYGTGILAKYGADGHFGNELAAALRNKGYEVPLQEAGYKKITEASADPLKTFDPGSVAKSLYAAIKDKDYPLSITLVKSMQNVDNYKKVAESFRQYFIGGVRYTIVNAMLTFFNEKSQKESTRKTFTDIGLKYDAAKDKWSL